MIHMKYVLRGDINAAEISETRVRNKWAYVRLTGLKDLNIAIRPHFR